MSKFIAARTYRMTDEEGNMIVSYVVKGGDKYAASLAVEETKRAEKLTIEVKPYKPKRSIEQNRLLWALLGKMAEAVSGKRDTESTYDCYLAMLEAANVKYEFFLALPEAEEGLREAFRAVKKVEERPYRGKTMNVYKCFVGSSKYDKGEMTVLIETTLDKLAELGVYDSEIETAREAYYG